MIQYTCITLLVSKFLYDGERFSVSWLIIVSAVKLIIQICEADKLWIRRIGKPIWSVRLLIDTSALIEAIVVLELAAVILQVNPT